MPTPADSFLILEFVAGYRLIPHSIFTALLASLPSVSPHTSPRLRAGLALRALDAALSDTDGVDAPSLLHKARAVLAEPDLAPWFPQHLAEPASADDLPAAAVAELKRLLDVEWASLPPSALEIAAERIVGSGALQFWANADHAQRSKLRLLVGESTAREILEKIQQQDASTNHPAVLPQVDNAPETNGTNDSDCSEEKDKGCPVKQNAKADHPQEVGVRHQQESMQGAPNDHLKESSVTTESIRGKDPDITSFMEEVICPQISGQFTPDNIKNHQVTGPNHSLMERNPTAITYERDSLGDPGGERPAAKRQLPAFERTPKPSPTAALKTRKKWSEIQEKTLLEGVKKYGKGNWKDIKMAYPDVFEDRSTVDLKDKFRNMERHLCV
ncbi:telomeric repeat-binding factor 2-like [Oryza brachyantha]|uniref:telomeric repeat-binding factor 2-like n=1 Tax=Oryza brachyantha TaxID=4533 RepID=UPI0003EAC159|nr:telomeric repeat-binding factor 2-like [Oryza brachyantha]XP_015695202.1 telomeric repeat-binding factor 2-like [Oryza brachyantha]XP_015695203.1 telomeric repeat-binding factor 2-like [Oryza brachyantha]XP_015695204.1 telomeric repeat-binding factor 2-like [Oryza brachyantha]XP_015695205.1 telomeric repeat-binding factor 2-like [Oryza brachyantha]XP_015695206.1 telomeric repeat-binding factor 2-like [Oryza brachyantha]XP_015695208.1 telomeric repeat-binding factor 2-like [Oryza brachyanth